MTDVVRSISIETSGPTASIALGIGDQVVLERAFNASVGHAGSLLPLADEMCREIKWRPADLNECHVSIGPGSFTGLRVAVAFARHLALANGARLVAVPSQEVIAWNLTRTTNHDPRCVAVFLEAKKGMVFAALFVVEPAIVRSVKGPEMVPPADYLQAAPRPLIVSGTGCASHKELIHTAGAVVADEAAWTPQARGLFELARLGAREGQFTPSAQLVPLYVRRPEAEELWDRRHPGGHSIAQEG